MKEIRGLMLAIFLSAVLGGVDYPVTMRREPPKDSTLKLIGPSEITHELADESPNFLFSSE